MSKSDHVRHYAIVWQLVDSLELLLKSEGASDEPLFLLVNFDCDIVVDTSFKFRLDHLDLLV